MFILCRKKFSTEEQRRKELTDDTNGSEVAAGSVWKEQRDAPALRPRRGIHHLRPSGVHFVEDVQEAKLPSHTYIHTHMISIIE